VGLLKLTVEDAVVVRGEVDSRPMRVAGNLAQASRSSLQYEVVRSLEPPYERAGEEAWAVPALRSLVDQQDHAVGRRRIVQAVERVDVGRLRQGRVGGIDEAYCRALTDTKQHLVNDGSQGLEIVRLREVQRYFRGRAVREPHCPVVPEEVLDNVGDIGTGIASEVVALDGARKILEDAIPDAFREAVPDNYIPKRLALEVRCTRGVH